MGNAVSAASTIGAPNAEIVLSEETTVRVRVPASSANLGPGFDCLGLALGMYDEVEVTVTSSGVVVAVEGEAAGDVPTDERHLVARAVIRGLEFAGVAAPGIALRCVNTIPHSRGLGSSAAAVVGGLAAASALLVADGRRSGLTASELVQLSSEFEGHPDNAAASVLGSGVVTWTRGDGEFFARKLHVHADIRATSFIPQTRSSTALTRGLLPDAVPRADAVFNLSRAALGIVALTSDPTCLFDATTDRLHQPYRAEAMPASNGLMEALRERGHAATVSGAGPSVLVLGTVALGDDEARLAGEFGFEMVSLPIAAGVEVVG
ncbi:homoserine kinase [Gordonia sp. HY442]|uniref:homoserine kinase n=1 Tax=Gordonia zhenghanii TaxID=2911516 RepID=UPI001EFF95C3|nr:homoserine kinase [Gordonia zhenghanii]MCF8605050.1 homoserine kinase [Gordonia zhenghanii]MCF8605713.1 homoserine kinase [Gordonia zhenghanii]